MATIIENKKVITVTRLKEFQQLLYQKMPLIVKEVMTTIQGYDETKTQVLKNVNGTLQWVDEQ